MKQIKYIYIYIYCVALVRNPGIQIDRVYLGTTYALTRSRKITISIEIYTIRYKIGTSISLYLYYMARTADINSAYGSLSIII